MSSLAMDDFKKWLDAYGAAWEAGDPKAAVNLFGEAAEYYETPFDEPMVGRVAIETYWREGAGEAQREVRFQYEALAMVGNQGLARWQASFVRIPSGSKVKLDGFLSAEFDADGKCSVFREWWHRREQEVT
jgi:hypothetical protein